MDKSINTALWNQFGASLEMLENAITHCPTTQWNTPTRFWYKAYHCLFWTDYFLTVDPQSFVPPPPFDFSEFDLSGGLTERIYSKEELLAYGRHCRTKAYTLINGLLDEQFNQRWMNDYKNYSLFEILLYNMRHIQHHSAQLNLLLRQTIDEAPAWVSQAQPLTF